jgi:hypothetical protein
MLYEAIRIFIFVQSIQLVFSLNSAEICINSSPCEEIHNFQCIKDICSVNKKTCDDYLVFKSILSQYFFKSLLVNFESNIQTCDSFKLTKNDYCLNNSNCLKKINFQWHFGFRTIKLKQECKCEGKNSFKCGDYCTSDKLHCDSLNLRIEMINKTEIPKCVSTSI